MSHMSGTFQAHYEYEYDYEYHVQAPSGALIPPLPPGGTVTSWGGSQVTPPGATVQAAARPLVPSPLDPPAAPPQPPSTSTPLPPPPLKTNGSPLVPGPGSMVAAAMAAA
eukprot:scaffold38132_cov39-Phaeocystis_antarctica.AAC.1